MDIIQMQCVELNWKTAQQIGVLNSGLAMRIRCLLDSNTFKVFFGPLSDLSKKDYISAFIVLPGSASSTRMGLNCYSAWYFLFEVAFSSLGF